MANHERPEIWYSSPGVPDMLELGHPLVVAETLPLKQNSRATLVHGYVGATATQAMEIRSTTLTISEKRPPLDYPFALVVFPKGHPDAGASRGKIILENKFRQRLR